MLKLIKNEYAKIFYKKTTYIILVLCLLLGLGISTIIQHDYDNEFYYEGSIEEEKSWYRNSDYIYDKLSITVLGLYEDMGYSYYSEIPDWLRNAVNDYVYNHYIYVLISQSENISENESLTGLYISDTDVEYEKEICEKMDKDIRELDYTSYYNVCIEYYEHQTSANLIYDNSNYEFAKYMIESKINPNEDELLISALNSYISAKLDYDYYMSIMETSNNALVTEDEFYGVAERYFTYKYIVDNRIENYMITDSRYGGTYSENKFMMVLSQDTVMAGLAGIFIIIIAAGIFANEYSNGTIKFLLINPVKRAKIFWSKYLSCITLFAGSLIIFYIIYFLFAMIICGADGTDGVFLSYADGVVKEQSIIIYSLKQYGLSAISMITSITLAFTISAFLRSTALAIAISLVIEFAGSTISLFLSQLGHDWGRYLIFSNTNLASFSNGIGMFPGQTLTFALVVIAVYMVIFLLTAYDGFTKKEI